MTREEAIKIFEIEIENIYKQPWCFENKSVMNVYEACKLAISALEQQNKRTYDEEMMKFLQELIGERKNPYDLEDLEYTLERYRQDEQEPSEDDGIDHEKIRKAFGKESDIKKADIVDEMQKAVMQVEEEMDMFIFKIVRPYCEEITQKYISKEILSKALTQYFRQEPCDDAISIDDVIEWLKAKDIIKMNWQEENARKELQALPSVQPSRRKGHWRAVYQGDEIINYRCSECELGDTNGSTDLYGWDYCRRCGADMRGAE